MRINDNRPVDGHTMEAAHNARRALLRSGPGALARVIGNPVVAAQIARSMSPPSVIETTIDSVPAMPVREPLFDVLDEGAELLVIADLPGVRPPTLHLTLDHN